MSATVAWKIKGLYFEACNCESVCPCYTAGAPTYGYCEGNCAWHITQGHFGAVPLDDLNVILVQRVDGHMRHTPWQCWWYLDDRASAEQFDALKRIFTLSDGGHLARTFGSLWQVQRVERAQIDMRLDGWRHRATVLGRLGLAIGLLRTEAGPALCRLPNVPGIAALAEEDWFSDGAMTFDYKSKNALTTTFEYYREP